MPATISTLHVRGFAAFIESFRDVDSHLIHNKLNKEKTEIRLKQSIEIYKNH